MAPRAAANLNARGIAVCMSAGDLFAVNGCPRENTEAVELGVISVAADGHSTVRLWRENPVPC